MHRSAGSLGLALLLGCGGAPAPAGAPVPVEGPARDVRLLHGEWAGVFLDACGARRGSMTFTLRAGRDTAWGRVVSAAAPAPAGCTDPTSAATHADSTAGDMVLRLGRLVVAERSVSGWIESYRDPERNCPVDTWFEGRLEAGDTLRGMYFAHPELGDTVRRGTWWAARRR